MEAPEKIYLYQSDREGKEYEDEWMYSPWGEGCVEYTRTDAFIEKACSGIDKLLSGYIIRNFHFGDSYDIDRLIEDFKNYMKAKKTVDFFSVHSREEVAEIDKQIEKKQKEYDAKLRDKMMKANDFPMTD